MNWSLILSLPHLALYFLWVRVSFFLTIVAELFKYLVSQVLKAGRPGCSLQVVRPKPSRIGASKIPSMLPECNSCTVHRPHEARLPRAEASSSQRCVAPNQKEPSCTTPWPMRNRGEDNRWNHWLSALRTGLCQGHSLFPCFSQFSIVREQVGVHCYSTNTCWELCEFCSV